MNQHIIIIIAVFINIPCFAHFTNDIVSYSIQSYMNEVFKDQVASWESQYKSHISIFNQNKHKEIERQLTQELLKLNTIPNSIKEAQEDLNEKIGVYNSLIIQLKNLEEELKNIQNQLNKITETIKQNNEITEQIASIVKKINQEAAIVNQKNLELTSLNEVEKRLRISYENKEYLSDDSITQFKNNLKTWKEIADTNWNKKLADYESKDQIFQQWVKEQTNNIEEQKTKIRSQQEQLQLFAEETNKLIITYNQDIQIGCKTQECEDALLLRKDQIAKQKAEKERKSVIFTNLITQINTQIVNYNTEYTQRFSALEELKKELEQLSQNISDQQKEKEQQLQEIIHLKAIAAERKWKQAQEEFNQFKESLDMNYGGNFNQLLSQFSEWTDTNKLTFITSKASADNQEDTEPVNTLNLTLCKNNRFSESQIKIKTICDLISHVYGLSNTLQYVEPSSLQEWIQKFNQKNQEVKQLTEKVNTLKEENNRKHSQLNEMFKQYDNQFSERQQQYEDLHRQLRTKWNIQVQQISRAYELKAALLEKEYMLLDYFLFTPDSQKTHILTSQKWNNFQLDLTNFRNNVPENISGFPPGFMQNYEIIATVLEKHSEDTFSYSVIPLSAAVRSSQKINSIKIEDVEKRQVILSWMNTPFISHYFNVMINRISDIFTHYNNSSAEDNKQLFIEALFLNSIYRAIPIEKAVQKDKMLYRIIFDNKLLWLLPEGKLALPKGIYQ